MAVQDEVRSASAPYIPWSTFKSFFENVSPLPNRIDRSVLRYTSGTNQTLLLHAFKALNLTGADGAVTATMAAISEGFSKGDKTAIQKLLKQSYPTLFDPPFNLAKATPAELREKFEGIGLTGSTARKSQAFFLAAAEYAGIEFSPHLKMRSAPSARRNGAARPSKKTPPPPPPSSEKPSVDLGIPVPIASVLQRLPKDRTPWSLQEKTRFLNAFEVMLDLCFPPTAEEKK